MCHSIIISIIIPAQWASAGDRNQAFRKRASTSTLYRSNHCKALQAAGGQDSNPGLSAQGCFSHAATFLHSFPRNEDAAHTHHYEGAAGGGCPPSPAGNHWKLTRPSALSPSLECVLIGVENCPLHPTNQGPLVSLAHSARY